LYQAQTPFSKWKVAKSVETGGVATLVRVHVMANATFEMSGGSITGNSSIEVADLFIDDENCTFLLSGSATIDVLRLIANNNTTRSTVTIAGNYSGMVTTLHLGGPNAISGSEVITNWTNAPVIVNGTATIISMFNNGGLGNFLRVSFGTTYTVAAIRTTHELNASGVLVLKYD